MTGKGLPPIHSRFKPGQSGNPSGKPKGLLTRDQLKSNIWKFTALDQEQLHRILDNPNSSVMDAMLASIMKKTIELGDASRLEVILNRLVGRPKEELEPEDPYAHIRSLPIKEFMLFIKTNFPEALACLETPSLPPQKPS